MPCTCSAILLHGLASRRALVSLLKWRPAERHRVEQWAPVARLLAPMQAARQKGRQPLNQRHTA